MAVDLETALVEGSETGIELVDNLFWGLYEYDFILYVSKLEKA